MLIKVFVSPSALTRDIITNTTPTRLATFFPHNRIMSLAPVFERFVKGKPSQYAGERFNFQVIKSQQANESLFNIRCSDSQYFLTLLVSEGAVSDYVQGDIWSGEVDHVEFVSAKSSGLRPVILVNGLRKVESADIIGTPVSLAKEHLARVVGLTLEQILASEAPPGYNQHSKPDSVSAPTPAAEAPPAPVAAKRATRRPADITPIEGVTPYLQQWKIRARAAQKSDVRTFSSQRGDGKLFNVTFIDETGEIRATFFGEEVDKFYNRISDGSVYYVTRARVGNAKKQFSNVNNEFELMADRSTQIEPCEDGDIEVPGMHYNFVKLDDLAKVENGKTCDVLTVIKEIFPTTELVSKKTSRPYQKRDVVLVDDSGVETRCTIWGDDAKNFDVPVGSVVAFKGLKVSDFGGRSLSALRSSLISPSPDLTEAFKLKGWYDAEGRTKEFAKQAVPENARDGPVTYLPIFKIINDNLGSTKREYMNCVASIATVFRRGLVYPACPSENCNKKVIQETNLEWRCEKCDKSYPEPRYRYIMSAKLADGIASDGIRVSIFDAVGEKLLGRPAKEINDIVQMDDQAALAAALSPVEGKPFTLRLSAQMEHYEDNDVIKYQVHSAEPLDVDCAKVTKYYLDEAGL